MQAKFPSLVLVDRADYTRRELPELMGDSFGGQMYIPELLHQHVYELARTSSEPP